LAKTNWQYNDVVKETDLNQIGQEINAAAASAAGAQQNLTTHKTAAVLDHPDGSVTTAKLAAKAVTQAKIGDKAIGQGQLGDKAVGSGQLADGAATDAVIGTRAVADGTAPTGDSGTLATLLGWMANMIKSITGKSNWRTAPATSLEAAKSHMDATAGVHGATASPNSNSLMQRDGSGRVQVAAPSAAADVARKDTVDGAVSAHVSAGDPHTQYLQKSGGTVTGPITMASGSSITTGATTYMKSNNSILQRFQHNNGTNELDLFWTSVGQGGDSRIIFAPRYDGATNYNQEFSYNYTSNRWEFDNPPNAGGNPVLTTGTHGSAGDPHPQYALKASPALTGTPTAPTAVAGTNSTQIATTAFVADAINSAQAFPLTSNNGQGISYTRDMNALLDTGFYVIKQDTPNIPVASQGTAIVIRRSSAQTSQMYTRITTSDVYVRVTNDSGTTWTAWRQLTFNDSPTFTGTPLVPTAAAGTSNTQIASTSFVKTAVENAKASPVFTGTPTAPTAALNTNTTQIATTAFVQSAVGNLIRSNGTLLEYNDGTGWKPVGGALYKTSNTTRVSVPTERTNTISRYKLVHVFYAAFAGEVKVTFDLKAGTGGTSPGVYLLAAWGRAQLSDNGGSLAVSTGLLDTTTAIGTESASFLDNYSSPYYDALLLGYNSSTTYATASAVLRITQPGPIFLVLQGAGGTILNCSVKNLAIAYDVAAG